MIESAKKAYFRDKLKDADSKSAFRTINGLLNNNNKTLPTHDSLQSSCDDFALYFKDKVDKIQKGLEVEENSINSNDVIDSCNQSNVVYELSEFPLLSENDMSKLIQGFSAEKNCLLDCIPTWFVKSNLTTFVPIITKILIFPAALKHTIISPIIKKPSLDPKNLKNYRPVSNIKFLSKVIEKHVVYTISNHMRECNLGEPLQSAYRTAHSTETALLKVKSDIMTSIYHRKGVFLVLLDLSAAFDIVTHSILFDRMEYELGIKGTALMWLKSYFSGRTKSISINGAQSANCTLDYGLPQGSIVGPLSFTSLFIPFLLEELFRNMAYLTISTRTMFNFTSVLIHLVICLLIQLSPNLPSALVISRVG